MDGGVGMGSATISFMKARNSMRRRRFLCAALYLAGGHPFKGVANSVVVPLRL